MAKFTKHVGQVLSTQEKCIVIFRQVPGEPENCLIVQTGDLTMEDHNDLLNELESVNGQQTDEFAKHIHTRFFRDGANMLQKLDNTNKLIKVPTNKIMMTPTVNDNIKLEDLNKSLSQLNDPLGEQPVDTVVAGDDVKPPSVSQKTDGVLDDIDLAKGFLSQADTMEAEAKNLSLIHI